MDNENNLKFYNFIFKNIERTDIRTSLEKSFNIYFENKLKDLNEEEQSEYGEIVPAYVDKESNPYQYYKKNLSADTFSKYLPETFFATGINICDNDYNVIIQDYIIKYIDELIKTYKEAGSIKYSKTKNLMIAELSAGKISQVEYDAAIEKELIEYNKKLYDITYIEDNFKKPNIMFSLKRKIDSVVLENKNIVIEEQIRYLILKAFNKLLNKKKDLTNNLKKIIKYTNFLYNQHIEITPYNVTFNRSVTYSTKEFLDLFEINAKSKDCLLELKTVFETIFKNSNIEINNLS